MGSFWIDIGSGGSLLNLILWFNVRKVGRQASPDQGWGNLTHFRGRLSWLRPCVAEGLPCGVHQGRSQDSREAEYMTSIGLCSPRSLFTWARNRFSSLGLGLCLGLLQADQCPLAWPGLSLDTRDSFIIVLPALILSPPIFSTQHVVPIQVTSIKPHCSQDKSQIITMTFKAPYDLAPVHFSSSISSHYLLRCPCSFFLFV